MLRKKILDSFTKILCKLGISIAVMEANSACPYLSYQSDMPQKVKNLRKF